MAKRLGTKPFYFKPLGYSGSSTAVSYDDAGEQIPYEYDLKDSYRNWFGSFMAPSEDPAAKARLAADASVIGYLQDDARRWRSRLAGAERAKVDAHLDALNLLQKRLTRPTSISCQKGPFLRLGYASEYRDPQNPHNGLLTSVANQFGMNLPGFGDARFQGELSGFLG